VILGSLAPDSIPPRRWRIFQRDCRAFLAEGHAAQAASLGWTSVDLFGLHSLKPAERPNGWGAVWLVHGAKVIVLTADSIALRTASGSKLTTTRRPLCAGTVPAWDLVEKIDAHQRRATTRALSGSTE
jgi:hypothetical protein